MSEQMAKRFMEALAALEESRDAEPLAGLYAETAKIGNVLAPDHFEGPDGARQIWTEYRGTFDTAASSFRNVIAGDGRAALEWTTEGTSFEGSPVSYSGVTILEVEGELITRSAAYFDPSALGKQVTGS